MSYAKEFQIIYVHILLLKKLSITPYSLSAICGFLPKNTIWKGGKEEIYMKGPDKHSLSQMIKISINSDSSGGQYVTLI